jgi:putative addiction module antidote
MINLKLRKVGNSLGVVLPKAVITRLNAAEGDRLSLIEGPNGTYQLASHDPAFERKLKKMGDIIGRYRNTLIALSK